MGVVKTDETSRDDIGAMMGGISIMNKNKEGMAE